MEEKKEVIEKAIENAVDKGESGSGFVTGLTCGIGGTLSAYGLYRGGKWLYGKIKNRKGKDSKTADDAIEEVENEVVDEEN